MRWCWTMWVQGKRCQSMNCLKVFPYTSKKLNCEKNVYELEDHVEEKALSSNLLPKVGLARKTCLASFFSCLLESIWVEFAFPYAKLLHHKRAKQDTIRVTRRTNVMLPHHKGLMPAYPMKKETPFIYHIIKQ